jgi:hypothetical protein
MEGRGCGGLDGGVDLDEVLRCERQTRPLATAGCGVPLVWQENDRMPVAEQV